MALNNNKAFWLLNGGGVVECWDLLCYEAQISTTWSEFPLISSSTATTRANSNNILLIINVIRHYFVHQLVAVVGAHCLWLSALWVRSW